LLARGCEVLAAVRPRCGAETVFEDLAPTPGFRLIAAPVVDPGPSVAEAGRDGATLADRLLRFGYGDPDRIFPAAQAWHAILHRLRPTLAISDAAPSLNLVAKGQVPLCCMGSGYLTPPTGRPLPPIPPNRRVHPTGRARELRVLAAVNRIRAANGLGSFAYCADLWNGDTTFVAAPRALDPHAGRSGRRYVEPFNNRWAAQGHPIACKAYVYMPHSPDVGTALATALSQRGLRTAAHLGRAPVPPGVIACAPLPPPLTRRLAGVRLFVHEGGLGATTAALECGVAQLIVPSDAEKATNAALARRANGCVRVVQARSAAAFVASSGLDDLARTEPHPRIAEAGLALETVLDEVLGRQEVDAEGAKT
jgi:hypothetical protein